jgi:hypothetical protein
MIETSRDPALLPPQRSVDVIIETDKAVEELEEQPKQSTSFDSREIVN